MIYVAPSVFGFALGTLLMYLLSIAPTGALKYWGAFVLGLVGMLVFGYIGNTYIWPPALQKETPTLLYMVSLSISLLVWIFIPISSIRKKFQPPSPSGSVKDEETTGEVIKTELSERRTIDRQLQQDIDRLRKYRESKNFRKAVEIGKRLEKHPSFNSIVIVAEELGKTFLAMKLYNDAASYFKKAVKIEPNNSKLHYSLGLAYSRAGSNETAAKELEEANMLDRDNVEILTTLGYMYFLAGSPEKAINETERATKIDPNFKKASNNLAYYYAVSGRKLKNALDRAKDLVSSEPENAQYLSTKGKVHLARGEIDQAIDCLEKANDLESNNPYIIENLNEAYTKKRRRIEEE